MDDPIALLYWYWYALAGVLIILEMLAPGIIFLWLAIGAVVAGSALLAAPDLGWYYQLIIFALASGLSLLFGHNLVRRSLNRAPAESLNQRGQALVGVEAVLIEAIQNGAGRARIGDSSWSVAGPDAPVGARIRVIAADGARLKVELI